jgi:hypothetical protein
VNSDESPRGGTQSPRDAAQPARDAAQPTRGTARPPWETAEIPRAITEPSSDTAEPSDQTVEFFRVTAPSPRDTAGSARDTTGPAQDTAGPGQDTAGPVSSGRIVPWLVLAGYLLGALAVTRQLWVHPASRAQPHDLHDVDQYTWFMRYSATAVAHGHLPSLITTAMNPPHGVNLMWNTSFLLPGMLLTPVTLLAGPQVSLTLALTLGFAGSAASLFGVLRRWGVSVGAAALGGVVYGFSPALVNSGIGHYHMQFAVLPPLIISALLRLLTGRGHAVRTGLWLGALLAAQLFCGEELLIDTVVAAVVLVAILAASRPRAVLAQARGKLAGLAAGAAVALVLSARALWVQFHGASLRGSGASTYIMFDGRITFIRSLPTAFITPSRSVLLHTSASAATAAHYPQPDTEYLAYLGWPLIVVLIAITICLWRQLPVRVTAVTVIVLELCSLGAQTLVFHGIHYPGYLLPWHWLKDLPALSGALPDRLSIMADGALGAALAFAVDQAATLVKSRVSWPRARSVAFGIAILAIAPIIPAPYRGAPVSPVPAGYQAAFTRLHLGPDARVLVVPVAWGLLTEPMRWQADTGQPASMVGGDFISPDGKGRQSRAGREGQTVTTRYLDALWSGVTPGPAPTGAQVRADLAVWKPATVVAVTSSSSRLGRYLTSVLGPPSDVAGQVLAWRR